MSEPTDDEIPDHVLEEQAAEWEAEHAPPPKPHLSAVADRPTPYDPDAEEALLGAAMLAAEARDHLATIPPQAFHVPSHQLIAEAINGLHARGAAVDMVTVADELSRQGALERAGGHVALGELVTNTPSTSNAGRYAHIVRRHAAVRAIGSLGAELAIAALAADADPDTLTATAQEAIDAIAEQAQKAADTLRQLRDVLPDYLDELEERQDQELTGITTGIEALDVATGGLQAGRLYTVAGRPGMGKSDVAAHLARQAARAGHRTLVVSVEMSTSELTDRWLASESRLPAARFTLGQLGDADWTHVVDAIGHLSELPIWVDDNPGASLTSIRASLRRSGAQLVIVDYLQILDAPNAETRQIAVTGLIRALKHIARERSIPVVVLAQLNRSVESRLDKRPMASDLRESGAIEQESDVVIGLYRDDFYKSDSDRKGQMEMLLLKNRGGPTRTVTVAYFPETKQILNLPGVN